MWWHGGVGVKPRKYGLDGSTRVGLLAVAGLLGLLWLALLGPGSVGLAVLG